MHRGVHLYFFYYARAGATRRNEKWCHPPTPRGRSRNKNGGKASGDAGFGGFWVLKHGMLRVESAGFSGRKTACFTPKLGMFMSQKTDFFRLGVAGVSKRQSCV